MKKDTILNLQKINSVIDINFDELNKLNMPFLPEINYIFHKFFDKPNLQFSDYDTSTASWEFPECYKLRYYLYYILCKNIIKDATILDLGSNLSFFSVWAAQIGAKEITSIEPNIRRSKLGKELVSICNLTDKITSHTMSINECLRSSADSTLTTVDNEFITVDRHIPRKNINLDRVNVVFMLDVLYYLENGIDVIRHVKEVIRPKYLFLESTVKDDIFENGHFEVWKPKQTDESMMSYTSVTGLVPSRNAINFFVKDQGWKVKKYYDYQSFIGRGESPPRKSGHKSFYLLENTQ